MEQYQYLSCVYNCTECKWPRLQSSQEKPHWLRIDFDHWEELSDGEEGEEDETEEGGGKGADEEKKTLVKEKLAKIKEQQVRTCDIQTCSMCLSGKDDI